MSQEKILIVEDEADILNLLKYHLQSAGYAVFSTTSGMEALQMVHHHQPDLILLDLMLPGLDGFEVCRELKRDRATSDVAVIMPRKWIKSWGWNWGLMIT